MYTLKPIFGKKWFIECQRVKYLTVLIIFIGDWQRFIPVSVCVHAYLHVYVYFFWIFMIQNTCCAYCFEEKQSERSGVVIGSQQTEDGCHQPMWNTLFKQFTRFRAYQFLVYITWTIYSTIIFFVIHDKPRKNPTPPQRYNVFTVFRVIVP